MKSLKIILPFIIGIIIWYIPSPEGLSIEAWHLFAIFFTAILSIIINSFTVIVASLLAISIAILTGTIDGATGFSGFGKGFILLIVIAFLIANTIVKTGLGKRIAMNIIKRFGKSSLGLGYSLVITDMLIAPAFPSNTARSGVLYPITLALSSDSGSKVEDGTRKKLGNFLMMCSMAGLTISSALWLTAMAANPMGVGMANEILGAGNEVNFSGWFIAASVPCITAAIVVPFVLYKIVNPEIKNTPEAPKTAAMELEKMGKMTRDEKITGIVFLIMVILWALSGIFPIDKTAVAFLGLAVLIIAGIFTPTDFKEKGGTALETYMWFAILYSLSSALNDLGFMTYLGEQISAMLTGMSWPIVYVILIVAYVLIHYFFVSQTAQMVALFGVFLSVGVSSGVPGMLLALMLLFATNFFASITPQGSSANILYVSSGYLTTGEIYKYGGIVTLVNLIIFLTVGSAWITMVT
ncbi:dicarboxylate transporter 1, chloroplastic [Flavobacteriaceae bacterium UJ101]|nr:dicarboxylate transporter 1, chloroplastic [Flavobacteriaceae bacterium UJ101]